MASPHETLVFFRYDDLVELDSTARHVATVLAERAVPVNYQLIPDAVDEAAVDDLVALRRSAPSLIRFNQHGWRPSGRGQGIHDPGGVLRPARRHRSTRVDRGREEPTPGAVGRRP